MLSGVICEQLPKLAPQSFSHYDYIAFGKVVSSVTCSEDEGTVEFQPLSTFKGESLQNIALKTSCSDGGVNFQKGDIWLVFGKKNNAQDIQVHICGHSRKQFKNVKDDYYVLERGSTFKSDFAVVKNYFSQKGQQGTNLKPRKYEKVDPIMVPILLSIGLLFMVVGILIFRRKK